MGAQVRLSEENLAPYLRKLGVLAPNEKANVEPVGDGNINWVRRVRGERRSWVVKQARPTLERFPEYSVSTERVVFEARYYETVAPLDRAGICPAVVRFDPEQRVLVLEDLGAAERLDAALARGADVAAAAAALGSFLGVVHAATRGAGLAERFSNEEMRRLHGDHIFQLPYRSNDFPLSPALRKRALAIQRDEALVRTIDGAYARYLESAHALVHADVQPANVLLRDDGPRLLDAEIAHVGDPAFDLGQLIGHLWLSAVARADTGAARGAIRAAWSAYAVAFGSDGLTSFSDVTRYAGIELLRRTIGAARVPAVEGDEAAFAVLSEGTRLATRAPASLDALLGD
jgi:5-methylthioribose kinase